MRRTSLSEKCWADDSGGQTSKASDAKIRRERLFSLSSPMDPPPPTMQDETPAGIAAGGAILRLVRDLRVDYPMHVLHQPIDRETRGLLARRIFLVGLDILRDLCRRSLRYLALAG